MKWLINLMSILLCLVTMAASGQEKIERKIEIKETNDENGTSIQVKLEKVDGSVFEKTYSSREGMKNDPELKDLDLHFGDKAIFLMNTSEHQDGEFERILESEDSNEKGHKIIRFKSEDGKDFEWEGDSTLEMIFLHEDKISELKADELKDGNFTLDVDVQTVTDEDGNKKAIILKRVEKILVEIIDINHKDEISEIPGIHLNEGSELQLEAIDYFPNPNSGQFTLRFTGESMPVDIRIMDMSGKEVYREILRDFNGRYDKKINLSENDPGIYVMQVIQNNKSLSKKIVLE